MEEIDMINKATPEQRLEIEKILKESGSKDYWSAPCAVKAKIERLIFDSRRIFNGRNQDRYNRSW
jgi:hypothetical protein